MALTYKFDLASIKMTIMQPNMSFGSKVTVTSRHTDRQTHILTDYSSWTITVAGI